MNEELVNEENEIYSEDDTSEIIQTITSGTSATLQSIADFNVNFASGVLGIVLCLGLIFGAILGSVYDRIFRK